MQPNGEVGTIVGTLLKDIFHPVTGNVLFKEGLEVQVSPGEMTQDECKFIGTIKIKLLAKSSNLRHSLKESKINLDFLRLYVLGINPK